ncbi:gustatory receptor-like 36a [Drosophila takahashii]|uniref:gustatory receptor-like 36a n=1 Tax=Drosophila takahashii TaxID=29030 RepID=UPI001CF927DF|nr:uncharacterized protein CG31750-like [Drosophila takahashii]
MPEEGHGCTHRNSANKWKARVLRWSVFVICWFSYIFYRGCVVGQMKYDPKKGKMVIIPRNIWTKRIALCLKIFAMFLNNFLFESLLAAILPLIPLRDGSPQDINDLLYNLEGAIAVQLLLWNTARLYSWLSSLSWNRFFVTAVNDVILVVTLVADTFEPHTLDDLPLLILYILQLVFTLLQIFSYSYVISLLNILLLELFYNVYVAYQFLLLSCIAAFNRFLESYLQNQTPSRTQRLQLIQLYRLYAKISNGHQDIKVLWLPVASMLFSNIVELVVHWSSIIGCILFSHHLNLVEKWGFIFWKHLGPGLAPLLRILFVGLCNDRLQQMLNFLNLQLLIVNLNQPNYNELEEKFYYEIKKMQTCFDLQLRAQPIRNQIMSDHQVCGCAFVLDFFFCTILNSVSTVQYEIANGTTLN